MWSETWLDRSDNWGADIGRYKTGTAPAEAGEIENEGKQPILARISEELLELIEWVIDLIMKNGEVSESREAKLFSDAQIIEYMI